MTTDKTEMMALASLADETAHGHDQSGHVSPVGFVLRKCAAALRTAAAASSAGAVKGEPDFAASIAEVLKNESESEAACGWRSCSGCHETSEGAETGWYSYSEMFGCFVGIGCSECGGLGAVWEYWSKDALDQMSADVDPALTPEPGKAGGEVVREAFVHTLASLAAAISLLERTPQAKKAAPSDKMFAQMIVDYKNALEAGRQAALSTSQPDTAAQGGNQSDGYDVRFHENALDQLGAAQSPSEPDWKQDQAETTRIKPQQSDPAPAKPMSGLYLDRFEVRRILIEQPDENLEITEAILADIDALPIHTHPIAPAAPVSVDEVATEIATVVDEARRQNWKNGGAHKYDTDEAARMIAAVARDAFKMERK